MSSEPGHEGKLTEDVCVDLSCYKQKAKAYADTLISSTPDADPSTAKNAKGVSTTTGNKSNYKKGKASVGASPKRVLEHIDEVHRQAAAKEIRQDGKMVRVYAALALLDDTNKMDSFDKDSPLILAGIEKPKSKADKRTALIAALYSMDDQKLNGLITDLASRIVIVGDNQSWREKDYLEGARETLKVVGADLAKHFTVDKAFLETHTKDGMSAIFKEAGLDAYYDEKNGEGAFHKMMNKKNAEIIEAALASGFDFTGFVPNAVKLQN